MPYSIFSQVLGSWAQFKSVYEKKLMAIVLTIQKWQPYLLGRKFVVHKDQRSLKFLMDQQVVANEHQKWISKLLGYNFDIEYKLGCENKATDALSKREEGCILAILSTS